MKAIIVFLVALFTTTVLGWAKWQNGDTNFIFDVIPDTN